jgi:hypothetical protein
MANLITTERRPSFCMQMGSTWIRAHEVIIDPGTLLFGIRLHFLRWNCR